MDNNWFFPLVILCTITHVIRTAYEILKHKNLLIPGRLSFIIVFTNMMLLWVSWFGLCGLDPYRISLPGIISYAGISLAGIGVIVFLTGLFTIKTLESYDGDLITTGIYSKIRHPMYTGFILWLIGFPIFNSALFSLFLAIPFIVNVLYWRYLEEKELEIRFSSYPEYKKTTLF